MIEYYSVAQEFEWIVLQITGPVFFDPQLQLHVLEQGSQLRTDPDGFFMGVWEELSREIL